MGPDRKERAYANHILKSISFMPIFYVKQFKSKENRQTVPRMLASNFTLKSREIKYHNRNL